MRTAAKYSPGSAPAGGVSVTGNRTCPPGASRYGRRPGPAVQPSDPSTTAVPSTAASRSCEASTTDTSTGSPSVRARPGDTPTVTGR
nr:hypothetical protein GCM10020093_077980 [Planobispora longispora]